MLGVINHTTFMSVHGDDVISEDEARELVKCAIGLRNVFAGPQKWQLRFLAPVDLSL